MVLSQRSRRAILVALVIALSPGLSLIAWMSYTHNFHAIRPGQLYRSAQMPSGALSDTIRRYKIKTVLNLRGPNPEQAWYRAERDATLKAGATLVDVSMSSCEWMSRAQLQAVVTLLETGERPILIHCQYGSERTGLISAVAELLRPGSTLDDARAQFSLAYLYINHGDGKLMSEHLDQYAAWLKSHEWTHSPERFRLWAFQGFQPKWPCREFWPYDPKPLMLVTKPPEASKGRQPLQR
jgi:protein tyrosine phosphatase (PTP) superfamily phosphohydrolase (DUF442 family)